MRKLNKTEIKLLSHAASRPDGRVTIITGFNTYSREKFGQRDLRAVCKLMARGFLEFVDHDHGVHHLCHRRGVVHYHNNSYRITDAGRQQFTQPTVKRQVASMILEQI